MSTKIESLPQRPRGFWRAVLTFFANLFWKIVDGAYPLCYRMGVRTMRVGLRIRRMLRHLFRPVKNALDDFREKHLIPARLERAESRAAFRRDCRRERRWIRYTWHRRPLMTIVRAAGTPFRLLYRHHQLLFSVLRVVLPVAAAIFLAFVIRYWSGATFALRLTYLGQYVGDIADEDVFDRAAALAEGRVINTEHAFSVDRSPELTLTLAQTDDLMNDTELCDVILGTYGDEVAPLSGIYVNGVFVGATDSSKKLNALLQSILNHCADTHEEAYMKNVVTAFTQDVQIVDGLYPSSAKLTLAQAKTLLTDRKASQQYHKVALGETLTSIAKSYGLTRKQLLQLNPKISSAGVAVGTNLLVKDSSSYLDVTMTCEEVREVSVPFKQETISDPSRYIGDNYVKIPGVAGVKQQVYAVSYLDGKEISRKKLSEKVIQEPVTQINAVGAYVVDDSGQTPGDGVPTGRFMWPLPSSYSVGETYGYQAGRFHNGIDIYGDYGAAILAADGGTVVEAVPYGYNGGWGLNVLIDHGNGYMTRYAHCSSIVVTAGEKVSKGQMIGRVGSTGYSTCNHLHFEVYSQGSRTDPYPFIAN